uniref:Uncharacterized protein n=1 Tax=Arundo donax TaxID=35708 RepID=A0A0A9EPP5_ARUDO
MAVPINCECSFYMLHIFILAASSMHFGINLVIKISQTGTMHPTIQNLEHPHFDAYRI